MKTVSKIVGEIVAIVVQHRISVVTPIVLGVANEIVRTFQTTGTLPTASNIEVAVIGAVAIVLGNYANSKRTPAS